MVLLKRLSIAGGTLWKLVEIMKFVQYGATSSEITINMLADSQQLLNQHLPEPEPEPEPDT